MFRKSRFLFSFFVSLLLSMFLFVQTTYAYSEELLKYSMRSSAVTNLQRDLKTLGVFSVAPTGYFGSVTRSSVVRFQRNYGLVPDGIVGPQTRAKIDKLLGRSTDGRTNVTTTAKTVAAATAARSSTARESGVQLLPWYGKVENIFARGDNATVTDIDTGLSFKIRRTYGYNHADVETLTAEDTRILKRIAGGTWNWTRRAIIVQVDGLRIAASMAPMPHAGRDDKPANVKVSGRSTGYGYGDNLDTIKKNGMDGHFDIHFYGSRTHCTDSVNAEHQEMVMRAYNLYK